MPAIFNSQNALAVSSAGSKRLRQNHGGNPATHVYYLAVSSAGSKRLRLLLRRAGMPLYELAVSSAGSMSLEQLSHRCVQFPNGLTVSSAGSMSLEPETLHEALRAMHPYSILTRIDEPGTHLQAIILIRHVILQYPHPDRSARNSRWQMMRFLM